MIWIANRQVLSISTLPGTLGVYILRKSQMSSGGQRGMDLSGITSLRLQNASDFTTRTRLQEVYQTFASTSGANAYVNQTPNGNDSYLQFLQGLKESCSNCAGLPYQFNKLRSFRA